MASITHRALAALSLATLASLSACVEFDDGDADTGTIGINLVGQGSSGATFRLRDATITVAGPSSNQVWNTEDDLALTSLSANVVVGDYIATLAPGWRLERLVADAPAVTVDATLESANPVAFAIAAQLRTAVPLRFLVDDGVIDMTQGYDITIDVDDPTTSIVTSAVALSVTEGGTVGVGVRLASQPAGPVSVQVVSSDGGAAMAAPATLTFTAANYAVPQQVTVIGAQDADLVDEAVTLSLSGAGLTSAMVAVAVVDDDVQAIVTTAPSLTVTEGATATFGIRLAAQPSAPVTVSAGSASAAVATVSPVSLTFTPLNYDVFQSVTVAGAQDLETPPSNGVTIVTLSAGPTLASVAVTVFDDDVIAMSPATQALCPGDGGIVTVRLLVEPSGPRTVTVTSNNASRVVASPGSLTFTAANWSLDQSVFVDAISIGSAQISVSGASVATMTANVTVLSPSSPACLL